eukprot:TRINITY_DN3132_c0_g1_i10.p2 TRINITY_DN3132_c0_g1~~TRINITY_DN3132_c0_g1_i10.p2  ORF type:complete len:131 (-),score=40.56 TRINITY_DN3132_c0_g1_i10:570-962(-)
MCIRDRFNNGEERKVAEPSIQMVPLRQTVPPEPAPVPPKDDTVSKLNDIMRRIQLKEEEEQRQKEEETRRAAVMQAQQAQYTTAYGMNPMMNPYMGRMNMCYANPYMTGLPHMQRPTSNSTPYQVLVPNH